MDECGCSLLTPDALTTHTLTLLRREVVNQLEVRTKLLGRLALVKTLLREKTRCFHVAEASYLVIAAAHLDESDETSDADVLETANVEEVGSHDDLAQQRLIDLNDWWMKIVSCVWSSHLQVVFVELDDALLKLLRQMLLLRLQMLPLNERSE